jgi:hypothetical protein
LEKRFPSRSLLRGEKILGSRNERKGKSEGMTAMNTIMHNVIFFAVNFFASVVFIFSSEW